MKNHKPSYKFYWAFVLHRDKARERRRLRLQRRYRRREGR